MENNQVLFKNTSKMDESEITLFQNAVMKKTTIITAIVFSLIFVAMGVGLSFWELTLGIITIACGVVGGFVLIPYLMKETQKKQNKEILGNKTYLNTYEFYNEYLEVTSQATENGRTEYEEVGKQKIYYKDIFKVKIYRERLFIFINARQSFIFNFKGMTQGTAGEVIELLKSNNIKVKDDSAKGWEYLSLW